ncbi:MAG: UDP-2,3-diacylglucosamine pyrophosphatase [Robiginitomaculum sp.]|nr:MAG: UDP-2,3-diacylglucosamine pyrophosphatase [Robiginitomaculum sp.]
MSLPQKIALIAGGGTLPHEVISGALQRNLSVYVAAMTGFAKMSDFDSPGGEFGLGEFKRMLKVFKAEKCTHIVMAGIIERPDFKSLKLDLRSLSLLPKVLKAAAKGDDALLSMIVSEFEKEGFYILAPQDICQTPLIQAGVLGAYSPTKKHQADIIKARETALLMGAHDIGQGCVVCNGLVLAVEAQEGTDKMLERVACLPENIRGNAETRLGVLSKRLKPEQEDRVDLPTIGPRTIELAAKAGLAGIVVEAGKAFVLDKEHVRTLADKHKIFVLGYEKN